MIHYEYNSLNKLASITDPSGQKIKYQYDKEGRRVSEINRNGDIKTYTFNSDNNPTYIGVAGTNDYEKYLYNADGSLTAAVNKNAVETYSYSPGGRIETKALNGRTSLSYEYNKNGQVKSVLAQNWQTNYSYDFLGRLTNVIDGHNTAAEYSYNPDNTVSQVRYNNGLL